MIAGTLEVQLMANMARLQSDMNTAKGAVSSAMAQVERSVASAKQVLGTLGLGLGLSQVIALTDQYTKFTSQLKLATTSTTEFARAQSDVRRIAKEAQADLSATGVLYARITNGTRELGISQQKVADITETVNLALKVSGATQQEAASAMLQLSQSFASGTLRGEEFNAVNEAAPRLMKALADGMGVPIGALKSMASEGKITSAVLSQALPSALQDLRKEAQSVQTIGGAFTVLKNNILEFVGTKSEANGTINVLTTGLGLIANNLQMVIGVITTLTAVKFANWLAAGAAGLYAQATASQARTAATIAAATADVQATAAAAALTTARVAELRAAVLAAEGNVALAVTLNGLIPAQARAAAAAAAHTTALATLSSAQAAGSATAGLATRALGLLGGPIGWITMLLGLGVTAWQMWGSSAKDSEAKAANSVRESTQEIMANLDAQIKKLKERNALARSGLPEIAKAETPGASRMLELNAEMTAAEKGTGKYSGLNQAGRNYVVQQLGVEYGTLYAKIQLVKEETEKLDAIGKQTKASEWLEKYATRAEKLSDALKKASKDFGGVIPPEIEKRIRDHFEVKSAGTQKEVSSYATLMTAVQERIVAQKLEMSGGEKLAQSQKFLISLQEGLRSGKLKMAPAHIAAYEAAIQELGAIEEQTSALKKSEEASFSAAQAHNKYTVSLIDGLEKLKSEVTAQYEANTRLGMTKDAIVALEAAKLQEQATTLEGLAVKTLDKNLDEVQYGLYMSQAKALRELADAKTQGASKEVSLDAAKDLEKFLDPSKANDFGAALKDAFAGAGSALAGLTNALQDYAAKQAEVDQARQAARIAYAGDADKLAKAELAIAQKSARSQIGAYASMAGAAKGFFSENSKGYKALHAAEQAFRVFEMAMSLQSFVKKMFFVQAEGGAVETLTALKIAGSIESATAAQAGGAVEMMTNMAVGQTAAVAGVANQSQGDPYTAFVRMAVMAAMMAALGFAVSGGGASTVDTTAIDRQAAAGTGSVLGDSSAKSESISKAIEILEENSSITLPISQSMLKALHDIRDNIGGLVTSILRTSGLTGTYADRKAAGESSSPGFLGAFATSTTLVDQGILLNSLQSIGQVIREGLDAQKYSTVNSKNSGLFGLFSSDSTSVSTSELDSDIKRQFARIISSMRDGVIAAADALGVGGQDVINKINSMALGISEISLLGMKGTDIPAYLESIFSKFGDDMTALVLPQVEQFQQVGEGLFQTATRLVSGIEAAREALDRFGVTMIDYADITHKQGDIGVELIRDSVVKAEGLGTFMNVHTDASVETYTRSIRTTRMRTAAEIDEAVAGMAGEIAEATRAYFGAMPIEDIINDTVSINIEATDVLRENLTGVGRIMETMTGSMDDLVSMYQSLLDIRAQMTSVGLGGRDLTLSMIQGAGGVSELGSGLSAYLDSYFTESEQATAALSAVREQITGLGVDVPNTTAEFRRMIEGLDTSTEAGQRLFGSLIGVAGAFADATNAIDDIARALASAKNDLQAQIMDLEGNTAGATALRRQIELEGLDPALRALKERVYALQDEKAASEAARTAATTAYNSQSSALKTTISQFEQFSKSLRAFRDSLLTGAMSNLSPEAKYLASKDLFNSTAALASSGDVDAIGRLQTVSQDFLNASKSYNASTQAYTDDFNSVMEMVNTTLSVTDAQTAIAQAQLSALETINASVQALGSAMGVQPTATSKISDWDLSALVRDYANYFATTQAGDTRDWAGGTITRNEGASATFLSASGITTILDQFSSAISIAQQSSDIFKQWEMQYGHLDGSHAGGLDYVPFDGYRAELHRGERVQTAAQARADDNSETDALLRQVLAELRNGNKLQGLAAEAVVESVNKVSSGLESNRRTIAATQS